MAKSNYWLTHFFDDSLSSNVDQKRRLYSLLAISYFGIIMLSVFSYHDYDKGNYGVLAITITTAGLIFSNLIFYYLRHNLTLACSICAFVIILFCLALVYQGGVKNTALYWVFPFPMVIFILLGQRLGFLFNGLLFVALTFLLLYPDIILATYHIAEKTRFLSSLFVVNAISYINEHYRERSHLTMSDLNRSKEQQANTDALTDLPNRRFIDSVFLPVSKESSKSHFPLVIIMGDVDHFKQLNDTYGHQMGDVALEKLARVIEDNIRQEDIIARVGGEEFLLLFSRTDYDTGLKVAEKIRKAISSIKLTFENQTIQISMSFGLSIAQSYDEMDEKLKEADDKLYQAKESGRNCVC